MSLVVGSPCSPLWVGGYGAAAQLLVLKFFSHLGEWMICLLCGDVATVVTKHMHTVIICG